MADIHVLTTPKTNGNRYVYLIYHIPINSPKEGVVPTPTSSIESLLEQGEIDALAAGTLYEMSKTFVKTSGQSLQDCRAKIISDYDSWVIAYNAEYDLAYQYYGTELNT